MISKANYDDLKEYWDYQRLLEYNREKVWVDAENFSDEEDSAESIFEILWNKIIPIKANELKIINNGFLL